MLTSVPELSPHNAARNSQRQPSASAQKAIGKRLIGALHITVWRCVPSQLRFVMALALRSRSAGASGLAVTSRQDCLYHAAAAYLGAAAAYLGVGAGFPPVPTLTVMITRAVGRFLPPGPPSHTFEH